MVFFPYFSASCLPVVRSQGFTDHCYFPFGRLILLDGNAGRPAPFYLTGAPEWSYTIFTINPGRCHEDKDHFISD